MNFPESSFEVARYSILRKFDSKSRLTTFCCLEIHVGEGGKERDKVLSFRIFIHSGILEKKEKVH